MTIFWALILLILRKFGHDSELKFSKIKTLERLKYWNGNFSDSGFAKINFYSRYEWQKNSEISTLYSFHLNDFVFQEGQWVWESSGVPFNYTNWQSGEPGDVNDDCLLIYRSGKKWYDYNCDNTAWQKPLCQIDAYN